METWERMAHACTTTASARDHARGEDRGPVLSESTLNIGGGSILVLNSHFFHLPIWLLFMTSPSTLFKSFWTMKTCIPISRHSGLIKMWKSPSVWTNRMRLTRTSTIAWILVLIIEIFSLPHSDPHEFNVHYRLKIFSYS